MSQVPTELKYASSHEWARLEEDGTITVGITDHAQGQLGDLVFVELPAVGDEFDIGFLDRHPDESGIVYALSRKRVEELSEQVETLEEARERSNRELSEARQLVFGRLLAELTDDERQMVRCRRGVDGLSNFRFEGCEMGRDKNVVDAKKGTLGMKGGLDRSAV